MPTTVSKCPKSSIPVFPSVCAYPRFKANPTPNKTKAIPKILQNKRSPVPYLSQGVRGPRPHPICLPRRYHSRHHRRAVSNLGKLDLNLELTILSRIVIDLTRRPVDMALWCCSFASAIVACIFLVAAKSRSLRAMPICLASGMRHPG